MLRYCQYEEVFPVGPSLSQLLIIEIQHYIIIKTVTSTYVKMIQQYPLYIQQHL